ncbi:MAG: DNA repair protein RecN [Gemmobacter sp.]
MLHALEIRDMLLVDRLDLAFGAGLNVLTGETGAGKSILLDCLGFVLGWRGRADLVRPGAEAGEVTAIFRIEPGHPVLAVLADAGIPAGDELILRRTMSSDGRRQAWANDRRIGAEALRSLTEPLVELHGQHDDRGLLDPRGHAPLLDAFAGAEPALAEVRMAWAALAEARRALDDASATLARARAEEDFLRHAVSELDRLAPGPGEDAALDRERRELQGAARIREDLAHAVAALSDRGAEAQLADALRRLEGAADRAGGRLEAPIAALGRALIELSEAQAGLDAAVSALDFDPVHLERIEERLFAIRALARKHGVPPDDLGGFADDLRARLAALETGAEDVALLAAQAAAAEAAHRGACARLTALRSDAAARLDAAMEAELPPLKLDRARFRTTVSPVRPGPDGQDSVTFTVATNPGTPAGPLNRIASGGELSRFLLALKVCLAGPAGGRTLIFDEIDRGVGGATADAVGRRLKTLAQTTQVLVVTHSPQVAAFAARHWRVEKREADGATLSRVVALDPEARVDEVARMLAGETVTDAARAAARALLAAAPG